MGSFRLPGKVLRPLTGRSVLGWVVRAARESGALVDLVVATTREPADDAIVTECQRLGVAWHRGPVDDVLSRFVGALRDHPADAVARFTADCPLLDPALISAAVGTFRAVPALDYLGTMLPRTLPRGMDVEIIGTAALHRADALARDHHRAHVTSYVYTHPAAFNVMGLTFPPGAERLRVTLDTAADWDVITAIVTALGDVPASLRTIIEWLEGHPEVGVLNEDVRQKVLEEA
jgi:spore coat polysaccharide biosynthesis protein SpsF